MITYKSKTPILQENDDEIIEISIEAVPQIELVTCSIEKEIPLTLIEPDSDIDIQLKDYIVSHGGGGGSTPGGGGEGCKCDLTYTNPRVEQNVGNVKVGESFDKETIQQVLDRIFAASYTKPQISIGLSCKSLYDKDVDSLASVTITANITKKSEDIGYVKFYVGSTLINTIVTGVKDGGIFKYTYTPTFPIQTTTSFRVETCDITTKTVVSSTAYVTFVQKSYWGVVPSILDATDPAVITVLNHDLKTSVAMTAKFTTEFGRFVFAYPKAIGTVKSIKDNVNNFNYTDSCSRKDVTINSGAYEVVYLTECAGFEDVAITYAQEVRNQVAISLADHFKLQKRAQNFERDSFLTLQEMRDFNPNYLPDIFTATCKETGKFYIYNIDNTVDTLTGKWREVSADISQWIQISDTTDADGNTITTTTVGGITTVVTKDPTGNIIKESGTIGGVTSTTETDASGNKHSSVGDKVVEGTKETTTTNTTTDTDGNTVTTTITTKETPNGTEQTEVKVTTKPDGSQTVVEEVINGGSDGVKVGSATGHRVTKELDSAGTETKKTEEDTSYVNGEEEQWATEEDIDDLYNTLLGGLGWIL